MSGTKDLLDKNQEYHHIAYDILLEIGAIKKCALHSDYYYETYKFDIASIYAISTAKLKEKYG